MLIYIINVGWLVVFNVPSTARLFRDGYIINVISINVALGTATLMSWRVSPDFIIGYLYSYHFVYCNCVK